MLGSTHSSRVMHLINLLDSWAIVAASTWGTAGHATAGHAATWHTAHSTRHTTSATFGTVEFHHLLKN